VRITDRMLGEVRRIFEALWTGYGPQGWWPAEHPWEMMVGAVLTQGTAWRNAVRCLENLSAGRLLDHPAQLLDVSVHCLEEMLKPGGFWRVKARRLRALSRFIVDRWEGDLDRMFAVPTALLRRKLLSVDGIGPETADCILLYAARRPVAVADAYTRRILQRCGVTGELGYEATRRLLEAAFPGEVEKLQELHALMVRVGKECCRKRRPRCGACLLESLCEAAAGTGPSPGGVRGPRRNCLRGG